MIKLPPVPELPRVESRPASKHYGAVYHERWEHFRDKDQPKRQYRFWAGDRCDLMKWYIYQVSEPTSL